MSFQLASLYEAVADADPGREVLVCGEQRLTYRELDSRANRLANYLAAAGIGVNDHVGVQLANCTEYVETMLACFKLRAVPVNVNYRYVERELRYLYEDAGLAGLVHHGGFADAVRDARTNAMRVLLHVDDGSGVTPIANSIAYDDALYNA